MTSKTFTRKMVPGGKEICEKQLFNLIDKFENIDVNDDQIESYLPDIYTKLAWLSREDLIKRIVSVEFNRFLSYYQDAPDLNLSRSESSDSREPKRQRGTNFSRYFINLGLRDNVNVSTLIGYLNRNLKGQKIEIGKVEIMKKFSFFEMDKEYENEILSAFKNADFDDKEVIVELSKPEPAGAKKFKDEPVVKRRRYSEEPSYKDNKPKDKKKYGRPTGGRRSF
jgi:ATP-dependent RNA helicase DeaD